MRCGKIITSGVILTGALALLLSGCTRRYAEQEIHPEQYVQTYGDRNSETQETTEEAKAGIDYDNLEQVIVDCEFDSEVMREILDNHPVVEEMYDFTGEWNRTNVHNSRMGILTINKVEGDNQKLSVDGELYYYSHSGWLETVGVYVTSNIVVCEYEDKFVQNQKDTYIVLIGEEDHMRVIANGYDVEFGFGANVSLDGDYTKDAPFYTNANFVEETFTQESLGTIHQILGEQDYEETFLFAMENGGMFTGKCILADQTEAQYVEGYVPTMNGYDFTIIITKQGQVYGTNGIIGFFTNVQGADELPEYTQLPEER